jgi:GDPmannose 4,6-dehydratase
MNGKRALITGITGQDGSYLAELLLAKGYEVHGIVRRVANENPDQRLGRIAHIQERIFLHGGSLESLPSLWRVVEKVRPDECYHLGAQSFVSYSFEDEASTLLTNITGTHNMLTAIHGIVPHCRFYFAATSEMFGAAEEVPQREATRFHPRSSYGISKVAGFHMTRNYREARGMYAASGILFNHESPRRGFEFVTRKISSSVARIKLGLTDQKLQLGTLTAKRDWGFAGDYVEAMWRMLQQEKPKDYVIATGETHTVEEFVRYAFKSADLNWKEHIQLNDNFVRPAEVNILLGDASQAEKDLGWKPSMRFKELVETMVKADITLFSGNFSLPRHSSSWHSGSGKK